MRMALFAKIHTNLKLTQQKERWKTIWISTDVGNHTMLRMDMPVLLTLLKQNFTTVFLIFL